MQSAESLLLVNGRRQPYLRQTLAELLRGCQIELERPGIAIAVNAEVVRRSEWDSRILQPGDRVEIVEARAGG